MVAITDNIFLFEAMRASVSKETRERMEAAAKIIMDDTDDGRIASRVPELALRSRQGVVTFDESSDGGVLSQTDPWIAANGRGEVGPDPFTAVFVLAVLNRIQGNNPEGDRFYQVEMRMFEERFPQGHWLLGSMYIGRGSGRLKMKRFEEAEEDFTAGYAMLARTLGKDHFLTVRTVTALVELYHSWDEIAPGRARLAEPWEAMLPK
jgi:hypothetical protein